MTFHTVVCLGWGLAILLHFPLRGRGNAADIIAASRARRHKALWTSSAARCGLKEFVLWPQRASVHSHVYASSLKYCRKWRSRCLWTLQVTSHRPHVSATVLRCQTAFRLVKICTADRYTLMQTSRNTGNQTSRKHKVRLDTKVKMIWTFTIKRHKK